MPDIRPASALLDQFQVSADTNSARSRVPVDEAEAYRNIFNHLRPHEALDGHRPIEVYTDPTLHPQLSKQDL